MKEPQPVDLSELSMLELFRAETETQTGLLTAGLLELEAGNSPPGSFEVLMRAAHSLKGAARIVNLPGAVRVAHALEDCFVAAHQQRLRLLTAETDALFRGVDLLSELAKRTEHNIGLWECERQSQIQEFLDSMSRIMAAGAPPSAARAEKTQPASPTESMAPRTPGSPPRTSGTALISAPGPILPADAQDLTSPEPAPQGLTIRKSESPERVLRLTAENLNRLLALAGESLVESRWLRPFSDSFQRMKRQQADLAQQLQKLRHSMADSQLPDSARNSFNEIFALMGQSQQFLADRMQDLDMFDRRTAHLAQRLYLEVLRTRMRPFSEGVRRFPRMVRDLARSLGKQLKFEISGESTQVDRDILERLETPLAHLLRNAVDHGCESPADRLQAGKAPECLLRLEARHSAGVLLVTVSDDGRGVSLDSLRHAIIQKGLTSKPVADKLSEAELLEFLFLPGFTLKPEVTEISGRGFGLDIVQNMVKSVRGAIRLNNQPGLGLRVQLQLPLTLSVLRALLVDVAGEPYAIPLSQINRTLKLHRDNVALLEGRPHFRLGGQQVGLLSAHQVLGHPEPALSVEEFPVVILNARNTRYGLVVDRFLGERELVVQPLDPRLGKVKDISAAALMEDGAPVLIMDVEDLVRSIEKLVAEDRLSTLPRPRLQSAARPAKRVLAVDDSLTVRELERKLLANRGYLADVAIDGLDAWHALRSRAYDLVITDIDMPRLDGVGLAQMIKRDPLLKNVPVLIVSYKDREEDRHRGLEAGADFYLAKSSFHDESLMQAVVSLIGEPQL